MRNVQDGIVLHTIPFYGDDRPESKKRRKRWVDFVRLKRAKWEPSKTSVVCSKHFKADDFVRRLDVSAEEQGISLTLWLKRDDYGINVFPSIHASTIVEADKQPSDRDKRMVRYNFHNYNVHALCLVVLEAIY